MSFSILTIEGNLTSDVKSGSTSRGAFAEITVAVNYKSKNEERAGFFNITFYDDATVNYLTTYGKKGAKIALIADIRQVKKDAVTYTNYYGRQILFLFGKRDDTIDGKPDPAPTPDTPQTPSADKINASVDDDLPF